MVDQPSDPYRSRLAEGWSFAPRQDPVVWGTAPGPLSAAQLAGYAEQGFVVLPGLLDPDEVLRLQAAAAALRQDLHGSGRDEVIIEPDSAAVRSVFAVHRLHAAFGALLRDERLAGAARQLLGSPVYIHQARLNCKPGLRGRPFMWHSDFETWHTEDGMPRMRALSVSLMLTENTEHNGPLMLIPGSHQRYVRCQGRTPPDHHKQSLRRQEYGVPSAEALTALVEAGGIVSAKGAPGTVVLFDCNTMHGSSGNITPSPRENLFFVYNSVDNKLAAPFGGTAPRPEHIAARHAHAVL